MLSTAAATPLLSSKTSVVQGNFCTTYACTLRDRRTILPETLGLLSYTYAIHGGTLIVGRESNMAIISASLDLPPSSWNQSVVRDFLRNFIGLQIEPNTLRRCVRLAMYTGSSVPTPLISGTQGTLSFSADCQAQASGNVLLTVQDQSFQPR
ncbi:hypothetical protein GCM10008957_32680 [Deinococcus ruber]|uniref:Uncharacterized protein n=1 Tax=Deinococcus ruber TaxID=1848197 RepID=A0A918CEP4_9DEIO|nr:hypothetical protein GCM10008957_32680 [Deinococcus ruber]